MTDIFEGFRDSLYIGRIRFSNLMHADDTADYCLFVAIYSLVF